MTRVDAAAARVAAAGTSLRRGRKPLHPRGVVVEGTVHRTGSPERFGVPWLDEPGRDSVTVRLSRSAGFPAPVPDVLGLALRVHLDGGDADLLFNTSGPGVLGRLLLRPSTAPLLAGGTYSTLERYTAATGPVLLAVVVGAEPLPGTGTTVRLAAARPSGPWRPFGVLDLPALDGAHDRPLDLDPTRNLVPGLDAAGRLWRIRAAAYAAARDTRTPAPPARSPEVDVS